MKVCLDSMLVWYPKIKDLPIPQPKTEIVMLDQRELDRMIEENLPQSVVDKVKPIAEKIGYPCFIRTDLASGKHAWENSCFVDNPDVLRKHIFEVISFNLMADIFGLDFKAIIIREYIPMDSKYTAFYGQLPINPERRYFIENGTVLCHHPYWIEEAIEEPSVPNWRELSKEMNYESPEEIKLLTSYSELVAKQFSKKTLSIDYCKAKDKRWILIDMATASRSWHPETCPNQKRLFTEARAEIGDITRTFEYSKSPNYQKIIGGCKPKMSLPLNQIDNILTNIGEA